MLQINLMVIFFLFLIVLILIDGIDEDFFDDLWKNLKPSPSKNIKKQKFREINAIKEEIVVKDEMYDQQNANKIMIKSENYNEKDMEDTKPKILQKIKNEKTFDEQNKNLKIKIKMPKIEMDKLSEESFENAFDEQADQNVSSSDHNDSADNDMEYETRNEMEILNKFNLMKKELRKENFYKNLTNVQFEREIAKKLGTNRNKIYKLKKKLGQKRVKTEESEETKMEVIRKFDQLRKEKFFGFKYDEKKRNKIECEIAKELGINRKKIYKWKKQLGITMKFSLSNEQKLEKIKQFERVKEEFSKKFNLKPNWKVKTKIAIKLGVVLETIYRWKMNFGLITRERKRYSDAEKLEYLKRSEKMKTRNPIISERKIAENFGIDRQNLRGWTKKFGTKSIH